MNSLLSDAELHRRDEEFDREDEKHRSPYPVCGSCNHRHYGVCGACTCSKFVPVSHGQKVSFADALMAPPAPDEDCESCHGQGIVKVGQTLGGYDIMAECSCITRRCEP